MNIARVCSVMGVIFACGAFFLEWGRLTAVTGFVLILAANASR